MQHRCMVFLALIAVVFGAVVVSGPVHAQNLDGKVLYCVEDKKIGIDYDKKSGEYEYKKFYLERFTLMFNGMTANIKRDSENSCGCNRSIYWSIYKVLTCDCGNGYYFSFNTDNKRFFVAHGFGYVFMDSDSISVTIGKCSDF